MYSEEQRRKAIETFIRFDHSYADTVAELGYPNRSTLRLWWNECKEHGGLIPRKWVREPRYSEAEKRAAVDYYLEHGKSVARTRRAMGYPSRPTLAEWIDELAPGEKRRRPETQRRYGVPLKERIQAVVELETRTGTAAEVAARHGVPRTEPYLWRRKMMGDNGSGPEGKGAAVSKEFDDLPDDIDELRSMLREAKARLRKVELELAVRNATLEIVKKDPGTDPNRLTNGEKAFLIDSLRGRWRLKDLLDAVGMAKSSYEYASKAANRAEGADEARIRDAVVRAFEANGGTYGYRRILSEVNGAEGAHIGEWTVRRVMREQKLAARCPRRKRRYSSYMGEISEAPANTCLDERGKHLFRAEAPNELWVTDITEFRIPSGRCYLSPVIDCFDGMPIGWSIGTSPNAELANSSLLEACARLRDGDHPRVHTDRGGHYRWPGWIAICAERGLVRSMSRKGRSPDNARAEGFFGRLKVEFFHGRDWSGVTMDEFMEMLDRYMAWYREARRKSDLGYMSPAQYRASLGLAA